MDEQVDVVILGLGTGGEELGGRLAMAGLDVVGIEPELVGGECAYWACIPTKMMVRAANLLQEARRVNGVAGQADVTPDWAPVATRIREQATGDWDDTMAVQRFEGRGGRFVRGRGALSGPRTVSAAGTTFRARRGVVIATGSTPRIPPIPGLADVDYWTSRGAISAERLPQSILILGGGAVGCEFGQAFSRFGVDVTIVDSSERLLNREEPEASAVVASVFEAEGIRLRLGTRVEEVESHNGSVVARLSDGGQATAERLLVATGRRVDVRGLGLETVGLDGVDGPIDVDERQRAAEGLWAIGDVTGHGFFTHMALRQARIVEADILGDDPPRTDHKSLPRVTFTDPEVGVVGLTEKEARAAGLDVAIGVKHVPVTFKGWIDGAGNDGVIKLVVDQTDGRLVGATAATPHGGEVLGMLSAAVHGRLAIEDLQDMVYAFPTLYGGIGEAVGAYARALVQVLDPEAGFLTAERLERTRVHA